MKSIFRTVALLVSLLATVSCNIDFLYIQLPDTSWFYELGATQAWVHFGPGDRVTIVQSEPSSGKCQYANGTWTASGHSVMITEDGGASRKLTRTFSHLKNSKNNLFSASGPGPGPRKPCRRASARGTAPGQAGKRRTMPSPAATWRWKGEKVPPSMAAPCSTGTYGLYL